MSDIMSSQYRVRIKRAKNTVQATVYAISAVYATTLLRNLRYCRINMNKGFKIQRHSAAFSFGINQGLECFVRHGNRNAAISQGQTARCMPDSQN